MGIDHDGVPLPQRYGAILTIVLSVSIAVLDSAIANVALPTIARELHASPAASIWVVNAYQLAIIVSLLSFASLGDICGRRLIGWPAGSGCSQSMCLSASLPCCGWDTGSCRVTRRRTAASALMNALTFGLALSGFAQQVNGRRIVIELCLAIAVGALFVRHQMRQRWPLLPVDLLGVSRCFPCPCMCTSICSFSAQMLAMVSLPFYLQTVLGRPHRGRNRPVAYTLAGALIGRVHAGCCVGGIGMSLFAAGLFSLPGCRPRRPTNGEIIWRMMLCGAGFGLFRLLTITLSSHLGAALVSSLRIV